MDVIFPLHVQTTDSLANRNRRLLMMMMMVMMVLRMLVVKSKSGQIVLSHHPIPPSLALTLFGIPCMVTNR